MVTKKSSPKLVPNHNDLILSAYFGGKVSARKLASTIRQLQIQGEGFEGGDVTLLDAAVAAVLLKSIRDELPQWAVLEQGRVIVGRKRVQPVRTVHQPKHLFTLNWADSGPGFSWPMAYHAIPVPAFKAVVVTASADGTDAYGFVDFAIGHFPEEVDLLVGAGRVIVEDWARQAANGQGRWAYLFNEALVGAVQAEEWANQVWPKRPDDEEAEESEGDDDGGSEG